MNKLEAVQKILESMPKANPSASFAIRYTMDGAGFSINYSTIVYFASESSLQTQLTRAREQAVQLIEERISNLKKDFKEMQDGTLKLENNGGSDDLELIQATSNSPRKISYFRLQRRFTVSQ